VSPENEPDPSFSRLLETIPILGARTLSQFEDNLGAVDVELNM